MYLVYFCVFLLHVHANQATNNSSENIDVLDVADLFVSLFGQNGHNATKRMKDLKDKLAKIDNYVVDKEKYTERILNETNSGNLTQTNFFLALNEHDHYRYSNDSRNLYLKMKEKMNRDDVLTILAKRGQKKAKKSARRMLKQEYSFPSRRMEKELDEAVDKYLGEAPTDSHKFNKSDTFSKHWDPQVELQEKKSYYQPSGRRIFKGERTTIRFYPFMASIHVMGRFWCGGVLYASDLVITSAACLQLLHNNRFYRENAKVVAVRVGSNHSRVGGELIDVLEVFFHPNYKPKTLDNNIAMIRLRRHIKLSYHRIPKLLQISHNEDGVPFTAEVMLLGWGVSKSTQSMAYEPLYLQRKMLPVYPSKFCGEVYGDKFNPRTMFCAGTVSTGEAACSHDAGGPAVLSGKLVGIISYGPTVCGYPDAPTVLTLVGKYADWIESVQETMPQYYKGNKRTTSTTIDPFVMYFYKHTVSTKSPDEEKMLITLFDEDGGGMVKNITMPTMPTFETTRETELTMQTYTGPKDADTSPGAEFLRNQAYPEDMPIDDESIQREEREAYGESKENPREKSKLSISGKGDAHIYDRSEGNQPIMKAVDHGSGSSEFVEDTDKPNTKKNKRHHIKYNVKIEPVTKQPPVQLVMKKGKDISKVRDHNRKAIENLQQLMKFLNSRSKSQKSNYKYKVGEEKNELPLNFFS